MPDSLSTTTDALIAEAERALEQGRHEAAERALREAIRLAPDAFPAHARLGILLQGLRRFEEAIEIFRRALEIRPQAPRILRHLGTCHKETNRLRDAIRYFRMALELRPGMIDALVDLGNTHQELGETGEALACHRRALAIQPRSSNVHHNMALCLFDDRDLGPAERAFRNALNGDDPNPMSACFLGILLEQQGRTKEAAPLLERASRANAFCGCLLDSVRYAFRHGKKARFFSNTAQVLRHALGQAPKEGLFLEFGVYYGNSLAIITEETQGEVHGFDSFEGLPESWFVGREKNPAGTEDSGAYSTGGRLPNVPGNAVLHRGWFEDSLPGFVEEHQGPVAFMNVDCDIYSSTKTIFRYLGDRIRPGTVIVFDEYFCYPEWREHEYRAFQEFIRATGLKYEYIAFSYFTAQAAVKIL